MTLTPPNPKTYEKLGAFYLGREYDLGKREMRDELLLYDSKDLTTHAVCVGMTGSGKTGLCVSLLKEAALDGVPALIIDPKGDLTNLLLTFPQLRGPDFAPWINEDDARRKGMSASEYANAQAKLWRDGLGQWGQDGERIAQLRQAADFAVYTPGSHSGRPLSVLSSFAAPPPEVLGESDLLRDQVTTAASSLLSLIGIDADPIRSREHILLSTIIEFTWKERRDLDLAGLIQLIQRPPVQRVGVLDLESFYPEKDRFKLALLVNNLLASPGFSSWLEGEPMDVGHLLYTPEGRPRVSIGNIAHLGEKERMFVVSLLVNQMLSWMRSRSGTTSLRALLYMDEIFGYMPPVAEPPSKRPLLTMLKQARAYGVGVVLATQNPVDLDYKGLSNTGTWFLGRLQTDRDKQRVLDGLEGAAAGSESFDRAAMEETLAGLGKRVFLMHNVHDEAPVVFHTRWAMSYLRGPLTRSQLRQLHQSGPAVEVGVAAASGQPGVATTVSGAASAAFSAPTGPSMYATSTHVATGQMGAQLVGEGLHAVARAGAPDAAAAAPLLPPDVRQVYFPLTRVSGAPIRYLPQLMGLAKVHFVDTRKGLQASEHLCLLTSINVGAALDVDWDAATQTSVDADHFGARPPVPGRHAELPADAAQAKSYTRWSKDFGNWIYRSRRFELLHSPKLKEYSKPGESEQDFRLRLGDRGREERDAQIGKLRRKYASKTKTLRDRVRRAELAVGREQDEARGAKVQSAISFGTTILSALLGRSAVSATTLGKATTAARGLGRAADQAKDVDEARANLDAYTKQLQDLESELESESERLRALLDPMREEFDTFSLRPRKTDIDIRLFALAWTPHEEAPDGRLTPAW